MDEKVEAQLLYLTYFFSRDGLATQLVNICVVKPGVVYEVLVLFNDTDRMDVASKFLLKIDYAVLQNLVKTNKGLFLCQRLDAWLSGLLFPILHSFNSLLITPKLVQLRVLISTVGRTPNITLQPRQLTQAEIDEYKAKPGGNNFDMDIIWELPESGPGFVAYNRNDEAADGLDQIGTKETCERIIAIAAEWHTLHSDRILQIGDISRPGGLDTSQHQTHEDGKIFDMRPLRNDNLTGAVNYTNSSAYDVGLTKEFIKLARQKVAGTTVLFNDKAIHKDDAELSPFVNSSDSSHNNHLHVMFPGGS